MIESGQISWYNNVGFLTGGRYRNKYHNGKQKIFNNNCFQQNLLCYDIFAHSNRKNNFWFVSNDVTMVRNIPYFML